MSGQIAAPAPPRERFHALDGARAIMLLLGIPFHTAEMYTLKGGWIVDAHQPSLLASIVSAAIHAFRMPGFFMLAGFFAAMLLARRAPGQWLANRVTRLLLPFATSLLLLGGWEVYWMGVSAGLDHAAALSRAFERFPQAWINHRWFLLVLFVYCLAIAAFCAAPRATLPLRRAWRWLGPARLPLLLLVLPIAAQYLTAEIGSLLPRGEPRLTLQRIAMFAPYFLIGALAFGDIRLVQAVFRPGILSRIAGAVLLLAFCALSVAPADVITAIGYPRDLLRPLAFSVTALAGVFISLLFFHIVGRFCATAHASIRYFVAASLTIYLFHEAFLLPLGIAFRQLGWPAAAEMLAIAALTLAGTVLVFEVIRRSRWASLVFNGGPASPEQPPAFVLSRRFRRGLARSPAAV